MNLKKLVRMAKDEVPNPHLARLSMVWNNGKTEPANNPIYHSIILRRIELIFRTVSCLLLVSLLLLDYSLPYLEQNHIIGLALPVIGLLLAAFILALRVRHYEFKKDRKNSENFLEAINILETITGKKLENWVEHEDLWGQAQKHLLRLVRELECAKKREENARILKPWLNPRKQDQEKPIRDTLDRHFNLLKKLSLVEGDKNVYFAQIQKEQSSLN